MKTCGQGVSKSKTTSVTAQSTRGCRADSRCCLCGALAAAPRGLTPQCCLPAPGARQEEAHRHADRLSRAARGETAALCQARARGRPSEACRSAQWCTAPPSPRGFLHFQSSPARQLDNFMLTARNKATLNQWVQTAPLPRPHAPPGETRLC